MSQKTDYFDLTGWIYLIYTQEELAELLSVRIRIISQYVETMAQRRIFDRVLETCIPVCFEGESLRKEKAAANLRFYRDMLA